MIAKYGAGFSCREWREAWRAGGEASLELCRQTAEFFGVGHVVLFSSARGALECLLRAIGGGGSAALPAYNCIAVPEAVARAGWLPRLVDIAPGSVNMSRETLEAGLAPDTRAVILTHQFGIPPEVEPLVALCRERGLFIVEDAAASLGASYAGRLTGTLGDAAVVSFGLTKVAPAGRVGALLTNDEGIAQKVVALRAGRSGPFQHARDGAVACAWWVAMHPRSYALLRRGRMFLRKDSLHERVIPSSGPAAEPLLPCSSFAAKLASLQLARLPANIACRQKLALIYREELSGCAGVGLCSVPDSAGPAWMQFPVFVKDKARCYRFLLRRGVDLSWTFRYSCGESYGIRNVPNSVAAALHLLGLPTYEGISPETARAICTLLRQAVHE
jgi:dTDP-4-amino-4,6-dideoxygalactose transaminase